jgi:choline dehydrogenase-like flavoprotein
MFYVVGSGPSGVSCAYALLRQGCAVTMLDSGLTLESFRARKLQRIQEAGPASWTGSEAIFLREGRKAGLRGIPVKLAYGSDFPYRRVDGGATVIARTGANLRSSFARGGFSHVWGSAVMPYIAADMRDWPIGLERLAPHYKAVFDFMPLAAREDKLTRSFPLYSRSFEALKTSQQAEALLQDLDKNEAALNKMGIEFGGARVAVWARQNGHKCVQCALCLYGCPYQLIYCSSATLQDVARFTNFHYVPGVHVQRVQETPGGVKIISNPVSGGPEQTYTGDRVYLACGVLQTTILMLRSLNLYGTPISVHDSQYFLLPILRFRGVAGVRKEALHTLAQVFLEITDPALSPYTIHLQAYTYNDFFEIPVRAVLGPLAKVFIPEFLISRLLLLQGFLHSAHSSRIQIKLKRSPSGEDIVEVVGQHNAGTNRVLRGVIGKLFAASRMLGAAPLLPLLRIAQPGRGDHAGGSFPMRCDPGPLETDVFGRMSGLTRVHAVDASIFPSVPATTITLSAMANAHRIGSELELYA